MGVNSLYEKTTCKANDQVSLKKILEPLRKMSISKGQELREVGKIQVTDIYPDSQEATCHL